MEKRIPIQQNKELRFTNHQGGTMQFIVGRVVGYGGSCIVYDGYYFNNLGAKKTVRIKECYPYKLHIMRSIDGLIAGDGDDEIFSEYKKRIKQSFKIANELHEESSLTNATSDVFDIYEAYNTVYIVSSYTEGCTLEKANIKNLREAVRVVISTAKCIDKIHKNGYLYLDIKPENIFVYEETTELIRLFDFDTVIPIEMVQDIFKYKISYTIGFAPFEQKHGIAKDIGKHTDVYSIGALLFYLLFDRVPSASDCGAEYEYSSIKWGRIYQNKLYRELSEFFNNTLQSYYPDRYKDMSYVIDKLEVIEKYADLPVPFVCSSYVENKGVIVGREWERNELLSWLKTDKKLLFLYGMGGIGKSTIARKFVSDNNEWLDSVFYLKYKGSICSTITDDTQFYISGCEKEAEETIDEYFARKIRVAKRLLKDTKSLLIIDNCNECLDENFKELLSIDWKIIIVTRSDMSGCDYDNIKIAAFKNKNDIQELFENNMGRKLILEEKRKFEKLVELVKAHTLILALIAKQISKSYIGIDDALQLAKTNGFSDIAKEKVEYTRDDRFFYDKIGNIIKTIYDVSALSVEKRKCMKIFSIFDDYGIDVYEAKELLRIETLDDINELKDLGWIDIIDKRIILHPLIHETMQHIPWENEYREIALDEIKKLYHTTDVNCKNDGYSPDIYRALFIAKSVLCYCGKDKEISSKSIYKDLMFTTLINLPKDEDEYIIKNADILFNDSKFKNKYSIICLYDYVVYLLSEKKDLSSAKKYLMDAKKFTKKSKDHYISGLYYDMLADYYEVMLNGHYYTHNEEEKKILELLEASIDKAIRHMKKSNYGNSKKLYAKYILGKVNLMIRSENGEVREIRSLLNEANAIIKDGVCTNEEVWHVYYMSLAWYYTIFEVCEKRVLKLLEKAHDFYILRGSSNLDNIDYFYIPAANMMLELGNIDRTISLLEQAIEVCDKHKDSVPYIRKKMELLSYLFYTYHVEGDIKLCRETLKRIDILNKEAQEFGINTDLEENLRGKME